MSRKLYFLAVLFLTVGQVGCGYKGPLVLPDQAQPAPTQQDKDKDKNKPANSPPPAAQTGGGTPAR